MSELPFPAVRSSSAPAHPLLLWAQQGLLGGCQQNGSATIVDVKVGDKVSNWNGLGVHADQPVQH